MIKDGFELLEFKRYLEEQGLSASTVYNYMGKTDRFLRTNPNLNNIEDYNSFLAKVMGKEDKRGHSYFYAIKKYLEYKFGKGEGNKICDKLLEHKVREPKTKRQYLSEKKRLEVINSFEIEKHRVIALIQMITGLRISSILRLKKGSITEEDFEDKIILRIDVIAKGGRKRSVYIFDKVTKDKILNFIKEDTKPILSKEDIFDNYLFLSYGKNVYANRKLDEHTLINTNYLRYYVDLKTALRACNVNISLFATHDFRRNFARDIFLENDNDITRLKLALGHNNIASTERYLAHSGLNILELSRKHQGF